MRRAGCFPKYSSASCTVPLRGPWGHVPFVRNASHHDAHFPANRVLLTRHSTFSSDVLCAIDGHRPLGLPSSSISSSDLNANVLLTQRQLCFLYWPTSGEVPCHANTLAPFPLKMSSVAGTVPAEPQKASSSKVSVHLVFMAPSGCNWKPSHWKHSQWNCLSPALAASQSQSGRTQHLRTHHDAAGALRSSPFSSGRPKGWLWAGTFSSKGTASLHASIS